MKWEDNVRRVVPYTPGEQPKKTKMIKLNTNENPYPPTPLVKKAIEDFDTDKLRMYPDPKISDLVNALADEYQVKPENVFVGIGSDDVLAMIFMTFFNSDKPIFFPDITYSFYDVWADVFRIPYETKPLNEKFEINWEDYTQPNGGVIFANPNAPTGVELPLETIEKIIQNNRDVIVVVDEAYVDFGATSALSLIDKYDNLIVTQTFSKSRSMAGMRIGYVFAQEKIISYLNDVKYSFNSYTLTNLQIQTGVACIQDRAYFAETCAKIIATREKTKEEMKKLGFEFGDSKTNFLFVTHPKVSAMEIFTKLREKDIYVRHFSKPERIDDYLRITIGTEEEMQELIGELSAIVS